MPGPHQEDRALAEVKCREATHALFCTFPNALSSTLKNIQGRILRAIQFKGRRGKAVPKGLIFGVSHPHTFWFCVRGLSI